MIVEKLDSGASARTLVELVQIRAQEQGDSLLYRFLLDGEDREACWTYSQLAQESRKIAALLQEGGFSGKRAILLYPPSLEYIGGFFACLLAGTIAVPAYPPDPNRLDRTLPRLLSIIEDCQAEAVLTTRPLVAMAEFLFSKSPRLKELKWIATDSLEDSWASAWKEPKVSNESLAFLQYSSGSTGDPKGVMLTHGNLLHNMASISKAFGMTSRSKGVIWLPPYHDMGLIGGLLQPLFAGANCVLFSPLDFLKKPMRWLRAISKYGGDTSGGPNFAYELCVRKATPEEISTLDLSTWNPAFCGAEPIHPETVDRFVRTFSPCGFRPEAFLPCYGLAEATLIVTGIKKEALPVRLATRKSALKEGRVELVDGDSDKKDFVGCGQSFSDQKVIIVSPETQRRCAAGEIGEIWVQGPSVALGYWNQPELTAQTFQAQLGETGEGFFLRTGDLGFILDGELFVSGRLKDLLIIRGQNHYPQDIEFTVERCHPSLRPGCCAAFTVEAENEEKLVIVQEVEALPATAPAQAIETILQAIRQTISEKHDLQVYSILLLGKGSIPKTSSGKIRRRACREEFLSGKLESVHEYRRQ